MLLALTGCNEKKASINEHSLTGVWADNDCELLRTDKYFLLFERCDSLLTSSLHYFQNDSVFLLGTVTFGPSAVVEQVVYDSPLYVNDADAGQLSPDGSLQVKTKNGTRDLKSIETIVMSEPYDMIYASLDNIGSCVQEWNLGVKAGWGEVYGAGQVYFEAGTNEHNYAFIIQPGFIYCRVARLRFNDRGGLFAQNIRLMSNGREHTSFMVNDNLSVSSDPLFIDNTKFRDDMCVYSDDGIYWSFIEFDGDVAVLNGCGEIYRYKRPEKQQSSLEEWIRFRRY